MRKQLYSGTNPPYTHNESCSSPINIYLSFRCDNFKWVDMCKYENTYVSEETYKIDFIDEWLVNCRVHGREVIMQ